jgi:hypothetical protein
MKNRGALNKLTACLVAVAASAVCPPFADARPPRSICVNPSGGRNCFKTIAAGLKHAHSGDSIDVVAGFYLENIRIGKNSKKGEKISVSLNGSGPGSTIIDGGARGTVVSISQAAVLLTGVTIQNGSASGIAVHDGTLALSNCVMTNNKATGSGGGIDFEVSNHPPKGTPQLHIDNTTISGNTTNAFGGGLAISGGSNNITDSTISGNSSIGGNGGGVEISGGQTTLTNSTISGNQATGAEPFGGGINCIGTLVLNNVTIANNSAIGDKSKGGGLFALGCSATVANTIIAGNSAFYGAQNDCGGNLSSQGHNLIDYNGCVTSGDTSSDIIGEDAMLGPLQLNSPGGTETQALLIGSPAIGAGAPGTNNSTGPGPQCLPTDQRGVTRPTGACDIGAYQASM